MNYLFNNAEKSPKEFQDKHAQKRIYNTDLQCVS